MQGGFYIEDEIHCEQDGPFESFEAAVAELRRRAEIAWDSPPNKAPCTSRRKCGREYFMLEYDARDELLSKTYLLSLSAAGAVWRRGDKGDEIGGD